MTLAFAMQALRRHLILFTIIVVAVTGAGIALGAYLPKTYSSSAQILLGVDAKKASADSHNATLYLKERAMTYAQVVNSDEVITPVATAADLDPEDLRERVVAAVVPETVVLDLSVTASTPVEAVTLTRALSRRFQSEVSTLNVEAGGPKLRPVQLSAPQPATAPDQMHGKTLGAVSALVGLVIAVLVVLLVAVAKRNRAAAPPEPAKPAGEKAKVKAKAKATPAAEDAPTVVRPADAPVAGKDVIPAAKPEKQTNHVTQDTTTKELTP